MPPIDEAGLVGQVVEKGERNVGTFGPSSAERSQSEQVHLTRTASPTSTDYGKIVSTDVSPLLPTTYDTRLDARSNDNLVGAVLSNDPTTHPTPCHVAAAETLHRLAWQPPQTTTPFVCSTFPTPP
eukprot:854244_1